MTRTCDRLTGKYGGWWRCGRPATVRSERVQVGYPHQLFRIHLCRRHQRYAKDAAPWVEVVRVVKLHPREKAVSHVPKPERGTP
jgi:hypothetical protein